MNLNSLLRSSDLSLTRQGEPDWNVTDNFQAAGYMGVPFMKGDIENLEKQFLDDVLKIELSRPNHQRLSVVYLPGLFHR